MHVLITGGAGFIGSHLTDYLLSQGHEVTILDDLSTGSRDNLRAAQQSRRFHYYVDTVFNRPLTTELVGRADLVFHLAAAVGVRAIVESPVRTIVTNVGGSQLVLEIAARKQKRIVITSSSEVYGKASKLPFREEDDSVLGATSKARWGYACSKMVDEFLALAYYQEVGLPVTIVRLFNTVGPRQTGRYGMVLPTFVQQALSGGPVTVFGSGKQSRSFTHVADVVSGLVASALSSRTAGEVFNLGNTEEISMNALARKVIQATASQARIVHVPYEQAYGPGFEDMERRVPDISKAREYFGFRPEHSLDEAIASVVESWRERAGEQAPEMVNATISEVGLIPLSADPNPA